MFAMRKVKSSAIAEVGYDAEAHILRIVFNHGAEYDYPDIEEKEFQALVSAPSVGRYYNQHIKLRAVTT